MQRRVQNFKKNKIDAQHDEMALHLIIQTPFE